MKMNKAKGGCHCGNISFEMEVTWEPSSFQPRACDCDFCTKHGAAYLSDNNVKVNLLVKNKSELAKYRQGSEIADFLICKICGVLVAVCFEKQNQIIAAVNYKAVCEDIGFDQDLVVSPKMLSKNEKTLRWQDIWFHDVKIEFINT